MLIPILEFIAAMLILYMGFMFCIFGCIGALVGFVACYMLPYDVNTCLYWGFGIGMAIQTIGMWREMLGVVISTIIGVLLGYFVFWIMMKYGVEKDTCRVVGLYLGIGCVLIGSSWMREGVQDFAKEYGKGVRDSLKEGLKEPDGSYHVRRNSGDEHVSCDTCSYICGRHCNLHNTEVGPFDCCSQYRH